MRLAVRAVRGLPVAPLACAFALACNTPSTKSGPEVGAAAVSAPVSVTSSPSVPAERASADAGARRADGARLELVEATTDSDAISLVRTKRLEAKAQGRVLVVYVGASWCPPCRRFKAEVEQGRLDDRLGKTTLLAFDADRDVDRLGGAGYTFTFVPFVALPGPDGHPSDAQEARGKGDNAWTELLDKLDAWQAR